MGVNTMSDQTKFEADLQAYFPDIYKIHAAGKFDKSVWDVFDAMMKMVDSNLYGEVVVTYQSGKINEIKHTVKVMRSNPTRNNLTHPGLIPDEV